MRMKLPKLLLLVTLVTVCEPARASKTHHSQVRYYLSATCRLNGDVINVFGATNLPPGSRVFVGVQDFIGSYSHTLADPVEASAGKDGLFKIDLEPKKGMNFKPNQICNLVFMPTDPEQPASVLKIIGKVGEHLGDPFQNPQIGGNVRVKTLETTTVVLP